MSVFMLCVICPLVPTGSGDRLVCSMHKCFNYLYHFFLQSLLAVETGSYVQFLPTLLNQLFLLLTRTVSEDVAINIAR
jgi:hypothetical protein